MRNLTLAPSSFDVVIRLMFQAKPDTPLAELVAAALAISHRCVGMTCRQLLRPDTSRCCGGATCCCDQGSRATRA